MRASCPIPRQATAHGSPIFLISSLQVAPSRSAAGAEEDIYFNHPHPWSLGLEDGDSSSDAGYQAIDEGDDEVVSHSTLR
jgi:hypothetical protein